MHREYDEYIKEVLSNIRADVKTKEWIRQSLTEHIDVLTEKHGSLAYKHLDPAEDVAREFEENLRSNNVEEQVILPWWVKRSRNRKVSKRKIFNLPLYHITDGYNPETGKLEVAKGFFAVGPVALGIFALGGVSLGVFSFGGVSLGLFLALGGVATAFVGALGGIALGGLFAIGGFAISFGLSMGGFAMGHVAIGGKVSGKYIYNTITGEGNAIQWFNKYLPYFVKYFPN